MKKISGKLSVCVSIMLCISMLFSIGSVFAEEENIYVEEIGGDIYQMVDDYISGTYVPRIDDPTFSPQSLFGISEDTDSAITSNSIYDVKKIDNDNTFEATKISFYSLEKEEQGELKDVIIMCRVVYSTIDISKGFPAYKISTVKGGVVSTTNTYIVDALYLKSTGNGYAHDASGRQIGLKNEGKAYTNIGTYPVTGKSYSISSGINYYYCPGVGGGTGGFAKGIVSAAHTVDLHDLEVGCGWV